MKNRIAYFIIYYLLFAANLYAQNKSSKNLNIYELVGTWQRGSKIVGNGLTQNFRFFKNGDFILNLGDDREDLRDIIRLKGKYRLNGDSLFLTIISRTIVSGKVGTSDGGIALNIFIIEDGKISEIKEVRPKELKEPVYITVLSGDHIKISNEEYFKLKELK